MGDEFEFVAQHSEELEAGTWIAVVGNELVAKGSSGREVFEIARSRFPKKEPLIMKAPDNAVMLI